ncbi:hypothetical protein [Ekhidna sp.]|uniref:hypothetical protein n=1 Tax=Ekhidna sp. TaxID=2608089 RepID=UPI003296D410
MAFSNSISKLSAKRLFLIDGIGATASAIFLGIILVRFNEWIGMPVNVLYILAALAVVFGCYSLSCHFLSILNWRSWLRLIAIVNLLYCLTTLILLIWYIDLLTPLGISYFTLEIAIIIILVSLEFKCIANAD